MSFSPNGPDAALVKVFSVTLRHSFYSLNDGFCPDFGMAPTPDSLQLMRTLGMAFRPDPYGFSIFIENGRQQELRTYLREHATLAADGASEYWERLTFSMQLKNPEFINITELPLATRIEQRNLYGSNEQAHLDGKHTLLSAGPCVRGDALREVIPADLSVLLPAATDHVVVTDISGSVVLPPPGTKDIAAFPAGTARRAQLSFRDLPFDEYTIRPLAQDGHEITQGKYPWTVLYAEPKPNAVMLLDMLFTQPTRGSGGVYPVPPLFDAAGAGLEQSEPVAYVLPFDARQTYWQYFIVSQAQRGRLHDLRISGHGTKFVQAPDPVLLPSGALATVFTAERPLALSQHSRHTFELTGRRCDAHGHHNTIRVSRLPVAATSPVWPSPDQRIPSGISEIYVYV